MWRFIPVWLVVAIMAVGASAIGSGVVQPAPAHAQTTFDVDLGVGWNLVSSLGEAAGVEEALGAAAGAVRSVNTYDARNQNFETFTAGGPALLNSLGTIPTGAGVWLLAEQAVTWSQPRLDGARSVPLLTGFNLVAWTGSDNTPIAGAVAALGGALESIFLWEARAERYLTFRPAAEAFLNSAEVLNYGDGLWALMNAPATWEQPAASAPTDGVDEPCMGDDYDRDEWGGYPPAPANAAPTWTKPHDAVHSRAITHDHHVALRDAHVSGGCDWSAAMKDRFSSDLANLNPTTLSFNASKGSRTPDQLTGIAARIIDTAAEQCVYARQHRAVKQEWGLTQTSTEQVTITVWLAGCGTTNGEAESEPAPESSVRCDPSYPDVCIPPFPPDLDCGDIPHRHFRIVGDDPHRFDGRDQDGIGCES